MALRRVLLRQNICGGETDYSFLAHVAEANHYQNFPPFNPRVNNAKSLLTRQNATHDNFLRLIK